MVGRPRKPSKYERMIPFDIPQDPDPDSFQRPSQRTADNEQPLLKYGDPVVVAKIRGDENVKRLREKHARQLEEKRLKKLAAVAGVGRIATGKIEKDG